MGTGLSDAQITLSKHLVSLIGYFTWIIMGRSISVSDGLIEQMLGLFMREGNKNLEAFVGIMRAVVRFVDSYMEGGFLMPNNFLVLLP